MLPLPVDKTGYWLHNNEVSIPHIDKPSGSTEADSTMASDRPTTSITLESQTLSNRSTVPIATGSSRIPEGAMTAAQHAFKYEDEDRWQRLQMPYGISPGSSAESLLTYAPGRARTRLDSEKIAEIVSHADQSSSDGADGQDGLNRIKTLAPSVDTRVLHGTGSGSFVLDHPSMSENIRQQERKEESKARVSTRNAIPANYEEGSFRNRLKKKLVQEKKEREEYEAWIAAHGHKEG